MVSKFPLNALGLSHQFMAAHIREGSFCIDAMHILILQEVFV